MSSDLSIELATLADLPRILALSNWAAEHTTANFATEPEHLADGERTWDETHRLEHPWLVARSRGNGVIAGFARSGPHKTRGAYRWTAELSIYIAPESHGKGVGTALYAALIPLLRAQGYVTLLAGITAGHAASEKLHAKIGMVRCATYHRAGWKFGAWHDVGYWEMSLRDAAGADTAPEPIRTVRDVWTER